MEIRIKVPADSIVTIRPVKKPDPKEVIKRALEYLDAMFKPHLEGKKE